MIGDAISIRAWIVLIPNTVCYEMITTEILMFTLSKLLHFSNGFRPFSMVCCTLIGTQQKKSLFSKLILHQMRKTRKSPTLSTLMSAGVLVFVVALVGSSGDEHRRYCTVYLIPCSSVETGIFGTWPVPFAGSGYGTMKVYF